MITKYNIVLYGEGNDQGMVKTSKIGKSAGIENLVKFTTFCSLLKMMEMEVSIFILVHRIFMKNGSFLLYQLKKYYFSFKKKLKFLINYMRVVIIIVLGIEVKKTSKKLFIICIRTLRFI